MEEAQLPHVLKHPMRGCKPQVSVLLEPGKILIQEIQEKRVLLKKAICKNHPSLYKMFLSSSGTLVCCHFCGLLVGFGCGSHLAMPKILFLALHPGITLDNAQRTRWNAEDSSSIGCLQGKHLPLCTIALASHTCISK